MTKKVNLNQYRSKSEILQQQLNKAKQVKNKKNNMIDLMRESHLSAEIDCRLEGLGYDVNDKEARKLLRSFLND